MQYIFFLSTLLVPTTISALPSTLADPETNLNLSVCPPSPEDGLTISLPSPNSLHLTLKGYYDPPKNSICLDAYSTTGTRQQIYHVDTHIFNPNVYTRGNIKSPPDYDGLIVAMCTQDPDPSPSVKHWWRRVVVTVQGRFGGVDDVRGKETVAEMVEPFSGGDAGHGNIETV